VEKILGEEYNGILVSDFYSAYNKIKALAKQKCIPHLLRDLNKVIIRFQEDKVIYNWCSELKKLLSNAINLKKNKNDISNKVFLKEKEKLYQRLDDLQFTDKVKNDLNRLSKRIEKFKNDLFTFLDYDNIDFHNNHAEQQIRPNVILRKITFGNRSEKGIKNHNILMSIIQTIKTNKKNPFTVLNELMFNKNIEDSINLIL
jgi:hypothetical protein